MWQEWLGQRPVPRYDFGDPRIEARMKQGLPVIIQKSDITAVCSRKWSLDHLAEAIVDTLPVKVLQSPSNFFPYSSMEQHTTR